MQLIHKPEVQDGDVAREIWYAIGVASAVRAMYGMPEACVCALRDGAHMAGSLHAQGRAVDLRTHDVSPYAARQWTNRVALALDGQGFDVVLESNPPHLHIEFDPKPGEYFWTEETQARAASAGNAAEGATDVETQK